MGNIKKATNTEICYGKKGS